jgi:hypothetical protein
MWKQKRDLQDKGPEILLINYKLSEGLGSRYWQTFGQENFSQIHGFLGGNVEVLN